MEIQPTVPRRVLKATTDLAILKVLASQAMTGYSLLDYFPKKTGITVTNTIVYSCLTSMERKGWIKCVSNRKGRVYSPSEKGKEIVAQLPAVSEEIQRYTRVLLG